MLIGIDIIEIERIKQAVERSPRLLERVFTRNELSYCLGKANPYPSLAVRWAVKEAVRKLAPEMAGGTSFHEVETISGPDGRPELILHGAAGSKSRQAKIKNIALSLSHSKYQAVAVVVAEKE